MAKSDPQKRLVYAMERAELQGHSWHKAPLSYLRRKAAAVCKLNNLPAVTVSVRKLNCAGYYQPGEDRIVMDVSDQNGLCLAHEMAHHMIHYRHPKAQDHGPEWAFHYGQMLRVMKLMTPAAFRAICAQYGVKHA